MGKLINVEGYKNGIEVYGQESNISVGKCDVLGFKRVPSFLLLKSFLNFKEINIITIYIFHRLGIDLSSKDSVKEALQTHNTNRVINIWNKMIDEFSDEEIIFSKLKDESFDLLDFENKVSDSQSKSEVEDNSLIWKGTAKQIELFEDKLVIGPQKDGLNNFISSFDGVAEIDVFYEDIRSVTVFKVGSGALVSALFSGGNMNKIQVSYLRIFLKGSEGNTPSHQFNPSNDPYSIIFNLNQVTDPDKFKSKIDKLISQFKSSNRNSQSQPISSADELEKFSNLLEKGIITEEEFQTKKKQLLGL